MKSNHKQSTQGSPKLSYVQIGFQYKYHKSVRLSGIVTIGRGHKIEYPCINTEAAEVVYSGLAAGGTRSKSRMARDHVRVHYNQPA